ncbi:MAG TPA: alpha/beta fold hydrolase [Limnobacter sp.]|uniref:alpha/beta hydrolase n=1 Tax=Limnobacter sp. TaxID=2003368 RepID=UPI002ED9439F
MSDCLNLPAGPHCAVLVHGLGANQLELGKLAQALHREGFSVVVPRIPGYTMDSGEADHTAWGNALEQRVRQLKTRFESVSLVGLSMGATLCLQVASQVDVDALVLLSICLAYDGWSMPWYSGLMRWARYIPFARRFKLLEKEPYGVKNTDLRAMIKKSMQSHHVSESGVEALEFRLILNGFELIRSAWRTLHAVKAPTLFIHAVDDEVAHIRTPERAFEQLASPSKEFIYLGDCYHMITVDNEREQVKQDVTRFLKERMNAKTGSAVFAVPEVISPELRRSLRRKAREFVQ